APKSLWPKEELVKECQIIADNNASQIILTENIDKGIDEADIVVTDVWVSMGEADAVWEERIEMLLPYQVNESLMAKAKKDAIFLHCLPSFHDINTKIGRDIYEKFGLNGLEVTDDIFEGPSSVVFDEAENRLHTIKAVIYASMVEK
ncbi:MAG: ornithine carbamoyltransferase, partial [Bacilli bacterium]|nr:ornithine carbamoyltransferase [Bacilli bacterium]